MAVPEWRQRLNQYESCPGLLQQLSNSVEAMAAPFWWSLKPEEDKSASILHNGTICYLHTGFCGIGITANHVLAGYLDDVGTYGYPAVECQFGSSTIYPENSVLSQDSKVDLATFSLSEVFVA